MKGILYVGQQISAVSTYSHLTADENREEGAERREKPPCQLKQSDTHAGGGPAALQ